MKLNEDFKSLIYSSLPRDRAEQLFQTLESDIPSQPSIRLNSKKLCACSDLLDFAVEAKNRVSWCNDGFYLESRVNFTADPFLHLGAYYVQDSSSMYLSIVEDNIRKALDGKRSVLVLDMCAAPGGKSTHLISLLYSMIAEGQTFFLFSNEIDKKRSLALKDNIARWGSEKCCVLSLSADKLSTLLESSDIKIDLALFDVPCSGEGMFRKSKEALENWSLDYVNRCASLQREILEKMWKNIRDNALIIYSTCTYNRIENNQNVDFIKSLGAKQLSSNLFIPGEIKGEGQYYALLEKNSSGLLNQYSRKIRREKKKNSDRILHLKECVVSYYSRNNSGSFADRLFALALQTDSASSESLKVVPIECNDSIALSISDSQRDKIVKKLSWICEIEFLHKADNEIIAYNSRMHDIVRDILSSFNPLSCGVSVATIKGKDLIPSHDFALSNILNSIIEICRNELGGQVTELSDIQNSSVEISCNQSGEISSTCSKASLNEQGREAIVVNLCFRFKEGLELNFSIWDVDKKSAQDYLLKNSLILKDAPLGYILLCYRGLGIGFVKNMGNRSNNLLPNGRRIYNQNVIRTYNPMEED